MVHQPRFYFWFPLLLTIITVGCQSDEQPADTPSANVPFFVEVTDKLGLADTSESWPNGHYLTPEITGGGVAVWDYDGDGDLDIYQVCHPPPAAFPAAFEKPAPNRLFEQQADGTFVDVTAASGLGDPGYGHGVAVGDIDNDGHLDVYVTNYGTDAMYRNNGDGTFRNVTRSAGVATEGWSSSAAFLDYDGDGDLDLYVARFARFDPHHRCSNPSGPEPDYCGPQLFEGVTDVLYCNTGSGVFTDVSKSAGITAPSRGWGIVCADLTGDGLVDIYVANDSEPNILWTNSGDGKFRDEAFGRGAAVNGMGSAEAGMGVASGDIDEDGSLELFITHLQGETNTLYLADEKLRYRDHSAGSGVGAPSMIRTGWGCGFLDLDHDGDLDLTLVNGRVARGAVEAGSSGSPFWSRYAEPNQVFENTGRQKLRFEHASQRAGGVSQHIENTRGLALGDIDGDGDIDLVTNNLDNTLRVFRNDAPIDDYHWVMVRPMTGKRDAYGAVVTVTTDKGKQMRIAHPTVGYLSSSDPTAHFGVGTAEAIASIDVVWPDRTRERFAAAGVDRQIVVQKGSGQSP